MPTLLTGQPAPIDPSSPARFRVENRYTGSPDVLGGGVPWPNLFLFYGVRAQPEQPDPETLEVGAYVLGYADAADGQVPPLKGSEHRSTHLDGIYKASPKVWHMALRIYRVA